MKIRGRSIKTKAESITEEGMLPGTLEYMAPEQLEGREADARTYLFRKSIDLQAPPSLFTEIDTSESGALLR
jgi:hypothetical protein